MKNILVRGKDWNDLIRKKKLLHANKEIVVGSTAVQFMDEVEIDGKMTWVLIYRHHGKETE